MFSKSILSAAALAITLTAASAAMAGGQVGFTVTADNAEEAEAIQMGLGLYQIVQGVESGAFVHQDGSFNGAALIQAGMGSTGVIHQEGDDHTAVLNQQGNDQAHGVFQFGEGTDANVTQTADGEAGLTFQFGWD